MRKEFRDVQITMVGSSKRTCNLPMFESKGHDIGLRKRMREMEGRYARALQLVGKRGTYSVLLAHLHTSLGRSS